MREPPRRAGVRAQSGRTFTARTCNDGAAVARGDGVRAARASFLIIAGEAEPSPPLTHVEVQAFLERGGFRASAASRRPAAPATRPARAQRAISVAAVSAAARRRQQSEALLALPARALHLAPRRGEVRRASGSASLLNWRSGRVDCRRCLLRFINSRAALSESLSRQCLL